MTPQRRSPHTGDPPIAGATPALRRSGPGVVVLEQAAEMREVGADRHKLALLPGPPGRGRGPGRARAAGLTPDPRPAGPRSALAQRDAVELLRAVAEEVGLLRVRGDRLEATSLRHPWARIDPSLRAGLAPEETRTVPAIDLAYYDDKNGWSVEPGNYEVIVGRHALDEGALRAGFAIA